jgi:hypothetical protein
MMSRKTHEPSPSGSLDGSGLGVELGLKLWRWSNHKRSNSQSPNHQRRLRPDSSYSLDHAEYEYDQKPDVPPTLPKVFSIACLRAPPSESLVDPAGARFFQKSEWLMCPVE